MLWMERFGISFSLIAVFVQSAGILFLSLYDKGETSFSVEMIEAILKNSIIFGLFFWITFRLIDYLGAGPMRRKAKGFHRR